MYSQDLNNMIGVLYECLRCGYRCDGKEIVDRGRIVCPQCGYRVIKKVRPPIVKRVKAI